MRIRVHVLLNGAALALVTALLAGCTSGSPAAGSGTRASAPPGAAGPASAGAQTTGTASSANCSSASDTRLSSVAIAAGSSGLTVSWASTGTDKAAEAIWVVTISGGAPNDYQLSVKTTNGVARSYVFNPDTATQVDVHQPGGLTVAVTGARESFPWTDLPGVGPDFTWNAVLNIDGKDVAYCPGDLTFLAFHR